jgi:hypothetical protein
MNKAIFVLVVTLFAHTLHAQVIRRSTFNAAKADSLYTQLYTHSSPTIQQWVNTTVVKYKHKILTDSLFRANENFDAIGISSEGDINALCFLVMMQANKEAKEDLKKIMQEVKDKNADTNRVTTVKPTYRKGYSNRSAEDINEPQSFKLQMLMERKSKMQSALSNIMKKVEETKSTIIGNMK